MTRTLLIAACVMVTTGVPDGQAKAARNDQAPSGSAAALDLKKLDSVLDDAFIRGDKAFVDRVLADGMIAVTDQGDLVRKADILNETAALPAGVKRSVVAEDVQVYLFGETAIVTSRKTIKEGPDNRAISGPSRETNTYVRQSGRWRLVASQQSGLAPPYVAKEVQLGLTVDEASIKGNKNATAVLIEFTDYQCPLCRGFAAGTMKLIETDYVDTGRIGFAVRQTPVEDLHPEAFKAAAAAHCAKAQGKFWEMNARLLQEPMALAADQLPAHARALGLDVPRFRQCLADGGTDAAIRGGMREAQGLGVQGTPIFLIGVRTPGGSDVKALRMIQGAHPYEVFKAALDAVLQHRH